MLSNLGVSKKYWYFSCFKTKINTKHEVEKYFNLIKNTHVTKEHFFKKNESDVGYLADIVFG